MSYETSYDLLSKITRKQYGKLPRKRISIRRKMGVPY